MENTFYIQNDAYLYPYLQTPYSCNNTETNQCFLNIDRDTCMDKCNNNPFCDYGMYYPQDVGNIKSVCSLRTENPIDDSSPYILYNLRKGAEGHTVFYKKTRLNTPTIRTPLNTLLYMGQSFCIKAGNKGYLNWTPPTNAAVFKSRTISFPLETSSTPLTVQLTQMFANPSTVAKPFRYGDAFSILIPNTSLVLSILSNYNLGFIPTEQPLTEYSHLFKLEPIIPLASGDEPYVRTDKPFYIRTYDGTQQYVSVNQQGVWKLLTSAAFIHRLEQNAIGIRDDDDDSIVQFTMEEPHTVHVKEGLRMERKEPIRLLNVEKWFIIGILTIYTIYVCRM